MRRTSNPPERALPLTMAFWCLQLLILPTNKVVIAAPWHMQARGLPSTKNPMSGFGVGECCNRLGKYQYNDRGMIKLHRKHTIAVQLIRPTLTRPVKSWDMLRKCVQELLELANKFVYETLNGKHVEQTILSMLKQELLGRNDTERQGSIKDSDRKRNVRITGRRWMKIKSQLIEVFRPWTPDSTIGNIPCHG